MVGLVTLMSLVSTLDSTGPGQSLNKVIMVPTGLLAWAYHLWCNLLYFPVQFLSLIFVKLPVAECHGGEGSKECLWLDGIWKFQCKHWSAPHCPLYTDLLEVICSSSWGRLVPESKQQADTHSCSLHKDLKQNFNWKVVLTGPVDICL